MARSHCIYVIEHNIPDADDKIIATFTVKHECFTWLSKCTNPYKGDFVIRRYEDNPRTNTHRDEPRVVPKPAARVKEETV